MRYMAENKIFAEKNCGLLAGATKRCHTPKFHRKKLSWIATKLQTFFTLERLLLYGNKL